jgi:4-amino-4-deoxy-L-arabinose transferase-like glycosyltransferase
MNPTGRLLLAIGIYFALHTLIRVVFSDSLELDEAEQMVLGQWLEWGYSSQPPLYTWLQKAFFELSGSSVLAIALLKNSVLFALYAFGFFTARRVLGDSPRAMLAALSLILMPPIAWESARDLTHTVLVAALVVISFYWLLKLLEHPTGLRFIGLGLILGLGLLSKYNFTLHLLALSLALLSIPEGRKAWRDRRILLTLLLALLLYAPHGWWMWHHHDSLAAGLHKLSSGESPTVTPGLMKLFLAILAYIAPLLLIWILLFTDVFREWNNELLRPAHVSVGTKLLGRYFLMLLLLLVVMVWFSDTGKIKGRWLFPYFVLFPPLLFSILPSNRLDPRRCRVYLGLVGLSAGAVIVALLLRVPGAGWTNQATDLNLPFAEFASTIRAAGFSEGLMIGHNAHIAGNFRHQFQEKVTAYSPNFDLPFPTQPKGQVLIVWETEKSRQPSAQLTDFVRQRLNIELASFPPSYSSFPYHYSPKLSAEIGFVIFSIPREFQQ